MRFNNPLPSSLASECEKCGRILTSFIDPHQSFGADKIIPPSILANAKGLAILTVIKAGFVGSARFGSGLIVARRSDGAWSAPSAIATAGVGFGGQLGFEITDFVFILNDTEAVTTFAQAGSLTLGGNVSVAAGPVGRNAEAAGAASLKAVAGIFSYSRTKGLFAGVSLEGSMIIERRDANERLYNNRYRAIELLMGNIEPPPQADPLLNILRAREFGGAGAGAVPNVRNNDIQTDEPRYESSYDDGIWNGGHGSGHDGVSGNNTNRTSTFASTNRTDGASWRDDDAVLREMSSEPATSRETPLAQAAAKKMPPPRPTAPKPNLGNRTEAIAMYTFEAAEDGDLGFVKGDVIKVIKKTDSETDWWTGQIGDKEGIFPSNYVKMKE